MKKETGNDPNTANTARARSTSGAIPVRTIDAGDFGEWLASTRATQTHGADSDVPCGDCNGCCRSFYFIHITPEDTKALAAIPTELLFAAPGLPTGHFVMGYNEYGHCPMLIDDKCSIYFDRPQTCRAYDCRIFTAADMQPGEADKEPVSNRTARWAFSFTSQEDQLEHQNISRAARWLSLERDNRNSYLPQDFLPSNSTQLAVMAIELRSLFGEDVSALHLASQEHASDCVRLKA